MKNNLFEQLRRKPAFVTKDKPQQHFFFQVGFDNSGAYLHTVDKKLKPVDISYRQHSGHAREVLRIMEMMREKNAFVIDWEKPSDRFYLADHEFILRMLRLCDNVLDADGKLIYFAEGQGVLYVRIAGEEQLAANVVLQYEGQELSGLQFLGEHSVMHGQHVYTISSPGGQIGQLSLFETSFPAAMLEKYLSLLVSSFVNLDIRYKNYRTNRAAGSIKAQAALIFEKVDENHSLYLRVTQVMPGFEIDFLEHYAVSEVVLANAQDEKLDVRQVEYLSYHLLVDEVSSMVSAEIGKKPGPDDFMFAEGNTMIISASVAGRFLKKQLPLLLGKYRLLGAEKLKAYKITTAFPKLFLKGWGVDLLGGSASLEIEGQEMSLFEFLEQYRANRYILLSDGTQALIDAKYIRRLERIIRQQKDGNVRISFFDLPLVEEMIADKIADTALTKSRDVFAGFNTLKDKKADLPAVNATLRPYQEQGFRWLDYLHRHQLGGCLADDMGLGKTLQTITLFSTIYPKEKMPSLLVMPKSLIFNWENELKKFNPALSFYIYYGANRDLAQAMRYNVILTTYATLRNDVEKLCREEFYYVVLDESQNAKNLSSQTSKAVMLLNGKNRLALSGTPVENNLTELYALFRFLNPSMFGTIDEFNRDYTVPIQQENDEEAAADLRRKIYPFILRRLKKEVLTELPDKIEQVLFVEMSDEQKKYYEERRKFFHTFLKEQFATQGVEKSQMVILQALTELRQIASVPESKTDNRITSSKREVLIEQLLDATANGHKVLVFANFINAIETISEELTRAGIHFVSMTGATQNRQELVSCFQSDPNCQVFLMTLKTGGVGLNLTAADMIFIFDPWWNTAAENQAIDRAHRIGQDKTVLSYKLIMKDTIEEKILELQEKKKALFDSIISSDSSSIKALTESDIDFMLGREK